VKYNHGFASFRSTQVRCFGARFLSSGAPFSCFKPKSRGCGARARVRGLLFRGLLSRGWCCVRAYHRLPLAAKDQSIGQAGDGTPGRPRGHVGVCLARRRARRTPLWPRGRPGVPSPAAGDGTPGCPRGHAGVCKVACTPRRGPGSLNHPAKGVASLQPVPIGWRYVAKPV
jgi:hypothetical protein